jgi:hypothetical protein
VRFLRVFGVVRKKIPGFLRVLDDKLKKSVNDWGVDDYAQGLYVIY